MRYYRSNESGVVYEEADILPWARGTQYTEVKVVPLDAIVIDRADLPEVSFMGSTEAGKVPGTRRNDGNWDTWLSVENYQLDPERLVRQAKAYLALDAHFREHPPVDEAQVTRIAQALAEDYDGRPIMSERMKARRLYERGVRVEVNDA